MRKILGLDLGVSSIGWALISTDGQKHEILGMGTRIVPLEVDEKNKFSTGNSFSKNQQRTEKRQMRRQLDRYQLRRRHLTEFLKAHQLMPDDALFKTDQLTLWQLRANAAKQKIELAQLGRVLYHLNQRRGYKSGRLEQNAEKKDTNYVVEVKTRHAMLKEQGLTIGQFIYHNLLQNPDFRIKNMVFPREAYMEEFDAIMAEQRNHYPDLINDGFINVLRNQIIYYQRPLKSQKGLVKICEFEGKWIIGQNGKNIFIGPRVAPRSSPIFQLNKIWQLVNNIHIEDKYRNPVTLDLEQKQMLVEFLQLEESLTASKIVQILKLGRKDDLVFNKQLEKGLQGNLTYQKLEKVLGEGHALLEMKLNIKVNENAETYIVDKDTGEIKEVLPVMEIDTNIEQQPLYQLWHTIYAIKDEQECKNALIKRFALDEQTAEELAKIDFTTGGFSSLSAKAMRKILPYLMRGYKYNEACEFAGYNHSGSLTKEEQLSRLLKQKLDLLPKNSLRQPIVEKILNQMIHVVNAIIETWGRPDEIRVELARELKQNKKDRNQTFKKLQQRERENQQIIQSLAENGLRPTRNNIIKYRLFKEITAGEDKINAICLYCGQSFGISAALSGHEVDVEHIIPKSLIFDDSQSNKTLSHRSCNLEKGNRTAYDYVAEKGKAALDAYIERVNSLLKASKITKGKRDKLLTPAAKIPKDFIERQLRQTQYISRKAREILAQVTPQVWTTTGPVTEHLRYIWGWNEVLHDLHFPAYKVAADKYPELIERVEIDYGNGHFGLIEKIAGWDKRNDHRHHAIDALVVACTQQGFIQRMNNLSKEGVRAEMYREVEQMNAAFKDKLTLLDKYLISKRPFSTAEVMEKASQILISIKPGKKVATKGRRITFINGKKIVQHGIVVPRGPLSEETVYGKITTLDRNNKTGIIEKKPLKYLFEHPDLIFKPYIKALVKGRLETYQNDVRKALRSLADEPLWLDAAKTIPLQWATCVKEEYVVRYPLEAISFKDVKYIVDEGIKRLVAQRFNEVGKDAKKPFEQPLYTDAEKRKQIRAVRLFTGVSAVEPIDHERQAYVKPGNNHHIAIYRDAQGQFQEHLCTFWHAVERFKYGLPVVIKKPDELWQQLLEAQEELPENFMLQLPRPDWTFVMEMQQNQMFVLGMDDEAFQNALAQNDLQTLSRHLYRVQKLASMYYVFRHHLETNVDDTNTLKELKKFFSIRSFGALINLNPIRLNLNVLGFISQIKKD